MVYDPIGDRYAEPALRSLAWYGRYLVVGFAAGEIPKLPLNLVLLKGCDVRGVFWGSWTEREPAGAPRQHRRPRALVRRRQAQRACARGLSARRGGAGAEGHRRPQGDGQGGAEAVTGSGVAMSSPCSSAPAPARRVAVLRPDVVPDQLDRAGEHGGIVGQADDRQHVGQHIKRQMK